MLIIDESETIRVVLSPEFYDIVELILRDSTFFTLDMLVIGVDDRSDE